MAIKTDTVAVKSGYYFNVFSAQILEGINLEDTGLEVVVEGIKYQLKRGTTFDESRKVDALLDVHGQVPIKDFMDRMDGVKYKCPVCGGTTFHATAHVTQGWVIDGNKSFVKTSVECEEVLHEPNEEDIWTCATCGHDAAGEAFLVKEGQ